MKAGDRALVTIGDDQHMCAVVESESKSVLMLVNDDGECVASIQQFWRKTEPVFNGTVESKMVPKLKRDTYIYGRRCENPACGKLYDAKISDLNRGWGRTCCKSCAATMRGKL